MHFNAANIILFIQTLKDMNIHKPIHSDMYYTCIFDSLEWYMLY